MAGLLELTRAMMNYLIGSFKMARNMHIFPRADTSGYQPTETEILQPAQMLQLKGMDSEQPLSTLDPGVARLVRNMCIRRGAYETRDSLSVIGGAASVDILFALDVSLGDGTNRPTRFTSSGVDVYDGANWIAATNTGGFAGVAGDFTFSAWGDTLMFRAGSGKIYVLTYGSPSVITEIAGAPTGAIHITTFGTRAVVTLPTQVQWSVRADNTDWAGLGSGFEDLRSAPGGRPDQPVAVIPITDETAWLVRTNSIWQITLTNDFDAPFQFNRLYEFIGGKYPQLCTAITQGLICVNDSQIWMVTPQGPKEISRPIKSYLTRFQTYLYLASATYDPIWHEYRLLLFTLSDQVILRYSIENDAWTEDKVNLAVRSVAYTVSTATGVPATVYPGTVYASRDSSQRYVFRDDIANNNTLHGPSSIAAVDYRIETADLRRTDSSSRKELVELILWYEAESSFTINIQYTDDGAGWNTLSSLAVPASSRPRPVSFMQTIDRDFIQLAVYTNTSPKVRLIKFEAMLREAGKITDAH